MLHFKRPAKPDDFEQTVAGEKQNVERAAENGAELSFENKWSKFKARFSAAQHGKCGYCENDAIAGQHGDVEHYRPKGKTARIKNKGIELDNLGNVRNRTPKDERKPGYWWLAYDWNNYLLSCANCNQKWKRNFFPVKGRRAVKPDSKDQALLLNPFECTDPVNHLKFDNLGAVMPVSSSARGKATIEVCGLDRPSITRRRAEKARRAFQLVRELKAATQRRSKQDVERALRDFKEAGREEYVFAGLVRSVLKHECGIAWDDLLKIVT